MRIAISGAGVAGPTLAYWLLKGGCEVTLIEAAPRLRTGGYMIDFWGVGFDVADRMGLLPAIRDAGYHLQEVRYANTGGRTIARISAKTITRELGDRFTSLPRGDLAAILFRAVEGRAKTRFGVTVTGLEERASGVRVTFSDGAPQDFDLLIGADGLHSNVRSLAFGPEGLFERRIGYYVAAFAAQGYAIREEPAYVSLGLPGRQISRFTMRNGRTMFLFVFVAERLGGPEPDALEDKKRAIVRVFDGSGWEWPLIAEALDAADDVYFDRVSQIALDRWSKGRVALTGDAAACVSLVAGEGTGLGVTEAYVLAGEICAAGGDHAAAFQRYESRLRSFVDGKQRSARSFASAFAPRTALGVWLRNQSVKLMAIPGLPSLLVGDQMRDDFTLPDYEF